MASLIKSAVLFILCMGCTAETENKKQNDLAHRQSRQADDCDTLMWNYTNVGQPFMMTWCTACHHSDLTAEWRANAPIGVDLNTHQLVQQYSDRILARATGESPTMPPAGGPSDEEIDRLRAWLECGAPE